MSPKVGISLDAAAWLATARTPEDKIRAAIAIVEAQGVRIAHGDYGVMPSGLAGGWVVDPARGAVSPLGAVVLVYQPDSRADMPCPAAEALGVSIPWVEGLSDGWDGETTTTWLTSINRRVYFAGVEAGFLMRFELMVRCVCGTRRLPLDTCPSCAEAKRTAEDFGGGL